MKLWRGFSIVELVVVIAIVSILIVAMTMLVGRFFTISRSQFEQTRTTEDARIQVERITDVVRNAHHLNCDANGIPDKPNEWWLQAASSTRVVFYSNIDADTASERITYEQNGNDFLRTIDQDTTTPCSFTSGSPQAVAHSIFNTAVQPLFEYIASDGTALVPPVTTAAVARVRIQLIVDANTQTKDNAASLVTEITPRLGQPALAIAPSPTPSASPSSLPGGLSLQVQGSAVKAAPELSSIGPVLLDLGEWWSLNFTYTGVSIDPNDPDLELDNLASNIAIVRHENHPIRIFGKTVGTTRELAHYEETGLYFDVQVRDGCWGNSSGRWVQPGPTRGQPQTMAQLCQSVGYSPKPLCGRVCDVPGSSAPGSDNHFGSGPADSPTNPIRPCEEFAPPYTGVFFQEIYCVP